jgi:5-methylcytosine-specific restriction endonuclease McrA
MSQIDSQAMEKAVQLLADMSDALRNVQVGNGIRILGGAWQGGDFGLTSYCVIEGNFHRISYVVYEKSDDTVLSVSNSKAGAIRSARNLISRTTGSAAELLRLIRERRAITHAMEEEERMRPYRKWQAQQVREKSVPRRRLAIFNKSEGKCHYCAEPLDLRGKWHIEHMMPKALLGSDDQSNLVASCVSCNMKKRDMTAEEFIAKQAKAA